MAITHMAVWAATVALVASACMAVGSVQAAGPVAGDSAHGFAFPGIDGAPLKLADYRGKVLLVVNTASFCGFTRQYAGLQKLWTDYEAKGLVVIGVPSNDFGEQEPKAEGEIKKFCEGAFGITFPLTAKQVVSGSAAHPFYRWAANAVKGGAPQWNFHKILVGRDGRAIAGFGSRVEPHSAELKDAIESALAAPSP